MNIEIRERIFIEPQLYMIYDIIKKFFDLAIMCLY